MTRATCPNCNATGTDLNIFQPTPAEGGNTELDCKNCNRSYEHTFNGWVPR